MEREPWTWSEVQRLVEQVNPDTLLQSCRGWHSPGVDSIVLDHGPQLMRLILVHPSHCLFVNMPAQQLLTWPIHSAKATHFVEHLLGHVVMYRFKVVERDDPWPGTVLFGGATDVEQVPVDCLDPRISEFKVRCVGAQDLRSTISVRIHSNTLRTYWVAKGKPAAWIVQESWPVQESVTWLNGCRRTEVPLYQPFSSASCVIDDVRQFGRTLHPVMRGDL